MKKTKKAVSLLLCAAMVLAAAGCSSSGKPASKDEVKKIGIIQLMPHNALDAANKGFVDGLAEAGYVDGENITIDQQNAQGDQSNCVTTVSYTHLDVYKRQFLFLAENFCP